MSRNRSLNPEEYAIAKEKYEAEASNMTRIRSLPVINIPYLKGYNSKIQHKLQKITYVPSILIDSNHRLVIHLMELPKEVENEHNRVWPIVCRFFLRKEKVALYILNKT